MAKFYRPTTYLTAEELHLIAAIKFQEAAITPEGPQRQEILKSAYSFRNRAEMKSLLSVNRQSADIKRSQPGLNEAQLSKLP